MSGPTPGSNPPVLPPTGAPAAPAGVYASSSTPAPSANAVAEAARTAEATIDDIPENKALKLDDPRLGEAASIGGKMMNALLEGMWSLSPLTKALIFNPACVVGGAIRGAVNVPIAVGFGVTGGLAAGIGEGLKLATGKDPQGGFGRSVNRVGQLLSDSYGKPALTTAVGSAKIAATEGFFLLPNIARCIVVAPLTIGMYGSERIAGLSQIDILRFNGIAGTMDELYINNKMHSDFTARTLAKARLPKNESATDANVVFKHQDNVNRLNKRIASLDNKVLKLDAALKEHEGLKTKLKGTDNTAEYSRVKSKIEGISAAIKIDQTAIMKYADNLKKFETNHADYVKANTALQQRAMTQTTAANTKVEKAAKVVNPIAASGAGNGISPKLTAKPAPIPKMTKELTPTATPKGSGFILRMLSRLIGRTASNPAVVVPAEESPRAAPTASFTPPASPRAASTASPAVTPPSPSDADATTHPPSNPQLILSAGSAASTSKREFINDTIMARLLKALLQLVPERAMPKRLGTGNSSGSGLTHSKNMQSSSSSSKLKQIAPDNTTPPSPPTMTARAGGPSTTDNTSPPEGFSAVGAQEWRGHGRH